VFPTKKKNNQSNKQQQQQQQQKQQQKKRKTERVIIRGNCFQIPLLAAAYDQRLISGDKHWLMFSEMHILQCSLS